MIELDQSQWDFASDGTQYACLVLYIVFRRAFQLDAQTGLVVHQPKKYLLEWADVDTKFEMQVQNASNTPNVDHSEFLEVQKEKK